LKASQAALPFFRPRSLTNARIGVEQGDCNVGGEDYFVILKVGGGSKLLKVSLAALTFLLPPALTNARI